MRLKFCILFYFVFFSVSLKSQIITTIAGSGGTGATVEGGSALTVKLGDMYMGKVAVDKQGCVYFAEMVPSVILKVDKNGVLTRICGNPISSGYTGDGGPAANALLDHPNCVAIDDNDNIYFADQGSTVIRKISPAGIITTISARIAASACGDGNGGPLSDARFTAISGIATDHAGNLYISDFACNTVRKVNSAGIITRIAGNGGNYEFAGDGGPATLAKLAYPGIVAVDKDGNVYIPDSQNQRIRKVDKSGIITTFAGDGNWGNSGDGGPALQARFNFPASIVIDRAGNFYVGDYDCVIRKIDPAGIITRFAGTGSFGYSGDGGPALLADLSLTDGMGIISNDQNDNIYFVDGRHFVIRKITNCLTASIIKQPDSAKICGSGSGKFSISATNADSYKWQLNTGKNWEEISDNDVYANSATKELTVSANANMDKYKYRCMVTNACGIMSSQIASLEIDKPENPTVSISTNTDTICQGSIAVFKALSEYGGNNPVFQWQKNGLPVGSNSLSYEDRQLKNGDMILCKLISNNNCVTATSAVSESIRIKTMPVLAPSITINSSSNGVCAGAEIKFSVQTKNQGDHPVFVWTKNGSIVGGNDSQYVDHTLSEGDTILCKLTSDYVCPADANAISNKIGLNIIALTTPSVVVKPLSETVCPGKSVTFIATAIDAENALVFSWQKNGIPVGNNSDNYIDSVITSSDVFVCNISAQDACLTSNTASSNPVSVNLFTAPQVSLDRKDFICEGEERVLDAGQFSAYSWSNGSSSRFLHVSEPGVYRVNVVDQNGCVASDSARISKIVPHVRNFLPIDTAICSYGELTLKPISTYSRYRWNDNSTGTTKIIAKSGLYWLEVTDNNGCTSRDTINVAPKQCMLGFYIPNAFTPNSDGKNDVFKPMIFGNLKKYKFSIFNRWGQLIFQTSDLRKGWDGTLKNMPEKMDVFVWQCIYELEGQQTESRQGTVMLVK